MGGILMDFRVNIPIHLRDNHLYWCRLKNIVSLQQPFVYYIVLYLLIMYSSIFPISFQEHVVKWHS